MARPENPHDQTPEKAFEELKAEYGDAQGSLDPLADFYERCQRPGESPCSYAIALESTLRAVEESQRAGEPFPDRDSKLTQQFLRGLSDEEVYARIAPNRNTWPSCLTLSRKSLLHPPSIHQGPSCHL